MKLLKEGASFRSAQPLMRIEPQADQLLVWAPAKVNLYLEVLGKRSDGYHEIETLMVAVQLYDTLTFKEELSGKIIFQSSDSALSHNDDNLVVKAARLLQLHTKCALGAKIELTKRIPIAAGLAGGSSDAAATVAALNRLWKLGLSVRELAGLGAALGSDVAFFLHSPAAWCTGRGEKVAPTTLKMPLWLVLLSPPFGLSTKEVYQAVQTPAQPQSGEEIRRALEKGDIAELGRRLHNRLQNAADELCPGLAQQRALLARLKPAGQLLSGSGTTMFALCRDHRQAMQIAGQLREDPELLPNSKVYVVRSCP